MSSPTPTRSIGFQVSLALVAVITLLLGVAAAIAHASYRAARWEDLHRNQRVLADQLAVGLASPLWNFDRPTLVKFAEGAFEDPAVVGLVIRASDDGSIVHARARRGESGSVAVAEAPADVPELTETRPILFNGESIGTLKVMASGRQVEADLRSTFGRVVVSILGLDLVVILALFLLFRRLVLRPLKDIEQYAVAVSGGQRGDPAILQDTLRGELSSLHASIVRMIGQLDARVAELARSNGELQEYAYVASHDLQEPLRAVAGCVQLLQQRFQGKLDARADELIGHAVDGALRMQALIEDLLTLSRVGTHGASPVPTDFAKVYDAALANLSAAIRESGAVLTHDAFPTLCVDPGQMIQLLQNLLSNAIKYRGDRPPAIHVGMRRVEGAWQVEVRDNGIGIEGQYFDRIFRLFQRLHTRRDYPGTGIGLAVCRKIVERQGGKIWVESEPGKGSTFFFTVPDPGGSR